MFFYKCLAFLLGFCLFTICLDLPEFTKTLFSVLIDYVLATCLFIQNLFNTVLKAILAVISFYFYNFMCKGFIGNKINILYSNHRLAQNELSRNSCVTNPMSSLILLKNAGYRNSSIKLLDNEAKKLNLLYNSDTYPLSLINDMSIINEDHDRLKYSVRRLAKDPFLFEASLRYYNYLNHALRNPERGFLEYNLIDPETTRNIYYLNKEEVESYIY